MCLVPTFVGTSVRLVDYTNDGHCDDGGEGASYAACPYGADCADCLDSTLLHPYPALLYSTNDYSTLPYSTPYSALLYILLYRYCTRLYSAPTPLYSTLPLQHSSLLTQPQLHPPLLHPYSTLPLLHLARHLRRRAPQLRALHTHSMTHLTAVRCFHPALLHCSPLHCRCARCARRARYRPAGQ